MVFKTGQDKSRYTNLHLRRQVIAHIVEKLDVLKPWLREQLMNYYGGANPGEPGPFSIRTYLEYMSKETNWGDTIFLTMMASALGIRITLVRSDNCGEMRFRHENKGLNDVDIVLIFNCDMVNGHYSSVVAHDGKGCKAKKLKNSGGYRAKDDKGGKPEGAKGDEGKGDGGKGGKKPKEKDPDFKPDDGDDGDDGGDGGDGGGIGGLSQKRVQELLDKEKLFNEIGGLLGRRGYPTKAAMRDLRGKGTQDEGGDSDDTDLELGDIQQKVKAGDVECEVCKVQFKNSAKLRRHVRKVHKAKSKFRCEECGKGFQLMEGYRQHQAFHKPPEQRIKCDECDTTFGLRKTLNNHKREKHNPDYDPNGEICPFKCGYTTGTNKKRNVKQHVLHCKNNPNKKPETCEVCNNYTSYHKSKVMQHKRHDHGWP